MAPRHQWQDPIGHLTIIKKVIPQWKNGLHDWQLKLVAPALDGEDIMCCLTTGGGKSALFAVPIIILLEISKNPDLYLALSHASSWTCDNTHQGPCL